MPPKAKFIEGERVLCFHGPLLYEAKEFKKLNTVQRDCWRASAVLSWQLHIRGKDDTYLICVKSDIVKEKSVRYFIHYNGWNKNWDEWVPESRVLKFNDAGLQKQKELKKAHENKVKGAKPVKTKKAEKEKEKEKDKDKDKDKENDRDRERASTPSSETAGPSGASTTKRRGAAAAVSTPTPAVVPTEKPDKEIQSTEPKKKRSRTDPTIESEENFITKIEIKVRIPEELKPWLVDDWDLVTRQKQLVSLPAKTNVDTILDDFVKAKLAKGNYPHKDAIMEVTQGLKEYFNVMLGTQLLYKFERPQYAEVLADHPDTPISQIYGAIHLLRLFVKLGGMLAYTQLDERSTQLLMTHLQDFLKYITKNASSLLSVSDYYVAPPEYHRKAL